MISWIFERHVRRSQRNTSRDRDFGMIFLARMPAILTHDKKQSRILLVAPLKNMIALENCRFEY